jgi:bifunctional damage-control phosphatase, subfamily II, fusion protein
MSTGGYND